MQNSDALRSNLYKVAACIVTASIIHGGPGFPHSPKAIFAYFQNPKPNDLVDHLTQVDIVDADYLDALTKV